MVSLTINDKEVQVEKGTTILDAAKKLHINIPTLCYTPDLPPWSSWNLYCACSWDQRCLVHVVQK